MIIQGKDLIVTANGSVIAAAKSCSLKVQSDTLEVSNPTQGKYRTFIPERMSWSVNTNHLLLLDERHDGHIVAKSQLTQRVFPITGVSSVTAGGQSVSVTSRGLSLITLSATAPYAPTGVETFDTWNNDSACATLTTRLTGISSGLYALVSYDAYGMTEALRTAIGTAFSVDASPIPLTLMNFNALTIIGGPAVGTGAIRLYVGGRRAETQLYLNNGATLLATPLRDSVGRVGQNYTLEMSLSGFPADRVTGQAICTEYSVQAAKGTLVQGGFSWQGSGTLE